MSQRRFQITCRKERGGAYYVRFAHTPTKWHSTGSTDYDSAIAWGFARQDSPIARQSEWLTFREFGEGFFVRDTQQWVARQALRGKDFTAKTLRSYESYLRNHLLPALGNRSLRSLTAREVDDALIALETSNVTRNKILHALRIVLQEACDQQITCKNIAYDVKLFVERPAKCEIFTSAELAKLFPSDADRIREVWPDFSWAVFFRVMAIGGLRPGEVAALQWADYHPKLSGLVVNKAIESGSREIKGLKTANKGVQGKACILDTETLQQLQELCQLQVPGSVFDFIFRVPGTGSIVTSPSSNKVFCGAQKRVGITPVRTQYCLRHTFQTRYAQLLDKQAVADLMGHTKFNPTYDHRTGEDLLQQYQGLRGKIRLLA